MKQLVIGKSILLPYLLLLAVAVLRLAAGHPYQFIPIFSCLLLFGACRPAHEFAIGVLTLTGVDIFITTHQYGYVLTPDHAITWLWYLGAVMLGFVAFGQKFSMMRVVGSSLITAVSFFVVSNFAVWVEWHMYPMTLSGLGACYVAALPFFRNSLAAEAACGLCIYLVGRYSQSFLVGQRLRDACL